MTSEWAKLSVSGITVELKSQISDSILYFVFLNFSKENISCLLTSYSFFDPKATGNACLCNLGSLGNK